MVVAGRGGVSDDRPDLVVATVRSGRSTPKIDRPAAEEGSNDRVDRSTRGCHREKVRKTGRGRGQLVVGGEQLVVIWSDRSVGRLFIRLSEFTFPTTTQPTPSIWTWTKPPRPTVPTVDYVPKQLSEVVSSLGRLYIVTSAPCPARGDVLRRGQLVAGGTDRPADHGRWPTGRRSNGRSDRVQVPRRSVVLVTNWSPRNAGGWGKGDECTCSSWPVLSQERSGLKGVRPSRPGVQRSRRPVDLDGSVLAWPRTATNWSYLVRSPKSHRPPHPRGEPTGPTAAGREGWSQRMRAGVSVTNWSLREPAQDDQVHRPVSSRPTGPTRGSGPAGKTNQFPLLLAARVVTAGVG